jgi:hypothetical protein
VNDVARDEFDYGQLAGADREAVREHATEIRRLARTSGAAILEIGRRLTEVKARLPHGLWYAWLQSEFAWSERSASRFMKVHAIFKSDSVADLSEVLDRLTASSVYMIASSRIPERARREVYDRLESGEELSPRQVEAIIEDSRLVGVSHTQSPPQSEPKSFRVDYEPPARPVMPRDAAAARAGAVDRLERHMRQVHTEYGSDAVEAAIRAYHGPDASLNR